ncbi:hypothetical protein Prum_078050 [Phytohabitans rumicis]|uniref:Uncharacterized protein n=1 Tax=Phytohabitans rumicis TaxID=1076125 RepID=A0A6V8LAC8_9ACTN|nr:hypothetical protein Prum_078050 [Phytohabitans rumicis]
MPWRRAARPDVIALPTRYAMPGSVGSRIVTRPPGAVTRRISRSAANGLPRWCSRQVAITRSKCRSGYGNASTSHASTRSRGSAASASSGRGRRRSVSQYSSYWCRTYRMCSPRLPPTSSTREKRTPLPYGASIDACR